MRWDRLKLAVMTIVAVTAITACGGQASEEAGTSPASPAGDRPLQVVGPFELHSVDPATAGGLFTRLQVAETLVDADHEGTLRPGLATEWTASPDGLTWTFLLRPDAAFHDATPVTAEAAAAALEVARGKEGPLETVPVEAIEADGESVAVQLAEPFPSLPAVLAHTSTQILAPSAYDADGAVTEVVGSGPYRIKAVQQPSRVEVVAYEDWHQGAPPIEEVHYEAVGRAETRALMAESGQADVTFGMDPVSLQRVTEAENIDIVSVTLPRTIQLKVNVDHEILGDVRVRQALSAALDREGMATALLRDPEMAANQLFPPSLPDWHQEAVAPLEHDADAARDLLAEAGWEPGPDGILVKDGRPLALSLRTFPDRPELPTLATAMQAKLREVGIDLDVAIGNSSEIPAGHEDGSLELALYSRNFALVPDPLVTLLDDFAPEGADWGAMGWSDATLQETLDDLAESGAEASDAPEHRLAVSEILQRDLPVIPVAWYRQSAVVSQQVEGFTLDTLERSWLLSELRWAA